jgi:hypothetical protein
MDFSTGISQIKSLINRINLVNGTFEPGSHTIFSYAPFLPTSVYLLVSTKGTPVICFIFGRAPFDEFY